MHINATVRWHLTKVLHSVLPFFMHASFNDTHSIGAKRALQMGQVIFVTARKGSSLARSVIAGSFFMRRRPVAWNLLMWGFSGWS